MGRKRMQGSSTSYGGLGLTKEEDRLLIKKLFKEDVSLKHMVRKLVRRWLSGK